MVLRSTGMVSRDVSRERGDGLMQLENASDSPERVAYMKPVAPGEPQTVSPARSPRVGLLTGGADKPYALGLASSLIAQGVAFDFIGSNEVDGPELHRSPRVRFLNLRGDQSPDVSLAKKVMRILIFYYRLLRYVTGTEVRVLHILWNNKLEVLDRTLILLYYRSLGKRLAFTAHNVNIRRRDGNDSWLNRATLRIQYRLVDHIFVHTEQMRRELQSDFNVPERKITVIPFGINNTVPNTDLTPVAAKRRLGLTTNHKVILFFGLITPYKGLEYLVEALTLEVRYCEGIRLIIAGKVNRGCEDYWSEIQRRIVSGGIKEQITERIQHIPDEEVELYFKAADVLVVPYTHIYQSGVLLLAYSFGLPVIATDVGSLKQDVIEGRTGFVCKPRDPADLARSLEAYFSSALYRQLDTRRQEIKEFADEKYSWAKVGQITFGVYTNLLTCK